MDENVILTKCITLLFRESQLENSTESSVDTVRTLLEKLKISNHDIGIATRRSSMLALKNLALDLCNRVSDEPMDATELLQQIRVITNGDNNLYTAFEQGIQPELIGPSLKRTITNLRKTLTNHYREQRTIEIVRKANRELGFERHNIPDLGNYIRDLMTELEASTMKSSGKDPALVFSMDVGDDSSMAEVFEKVTSSNDAGLAYTTGWRELNDALQGGPRSGDCVVIGALQHNYKSGMSLSMTTHIPIYNKPKCKDPTKKPLIYRVTLEDPARNNAQFMYQLLKYDETGEAVDVKGVSAKEMANYVRDRIRVNGYHFIIDEVNPADWTYQSLISRIIELESEGYCVEVLSVDYLAKLPTTGCVQGSIGDDMLDMLSRVRGFCSAHGILFITPHQLSTEAARIMQTVPNDQFLHAIKGGGYFEKTKGLGRIYDIGILIHKCETETGDYLHVVIDKHRFPSVADSRLKSFFMKFPSNKMPIPANVQNPEHKTLRKIPRTTQSKDDSFFEL